MSDYHIRKASVNDAAAIKTLLDTYSEQALLLPRPMSEIYALIPQFFVAETTSPQRLVGCGALEVFSADLGEIRSLAVDANYAGQGIGQDLLSHVEAYALELGLSRMMALTYVDQFFHKLGYKTVQMKDLPEKVWGVCVKCPKFHHCDEIPVLKLL